MVLFVKLLTSVTIVSIFNLSFGCCAQQQLSEEQWAKKIAKNRIKYLKKYPRDYNENLRLTAIGKGVDSDINGDAIILKINNESLRYGSPLVESIEIGDPTLVGHILDAKADPNMMSQGASPLIHLVRKNADPNESLNIADLLLRKKALVESKGDETALSIAINTGKSLLVQRLIAANASLDRKTGPAQLTADQLAAQRLSAKQQQQREELGNSPEMRIYTFIAQRRKAQSQTQSGPDVDLPAEEKKEQDLLR